MRSLLLHIISLAVCLMAATVAFAADFNDDGLRYSITADGETLTVISNLNYNSLTEAFIPEEVEHGNRSYTVTAVADRAFAGAKLLTLVSLPATVRAIGSEGSRNYSALETHDNQCWPARCSILAWRTPDRSLAGHGPQDHEELGTAEATWQARMQGFFCLWLRCPAGAEPEGGTAARVAGALAAPSARDGVCLHGRSRAAPSLRSSLL